MRSLLICVLLLTPIYAQNVNIPLTRKGANVDPARVRAGDRVVWTGNNWRVEFKDRTPCQNSKRVFTSIERGTDRMCIISVPCSATDKSGCGRYKYDSSADGGPVIDPEMDVQP